ncbi:MAG TPA: pyridoxal phosphate-dependent aminotransferase family protein [Verrucomicrobiota bacterium]|nr:pyridoxal phosphate-dependent aminotransferase family protein [Verrucomicrobiota bacterium]HNT15280.1 pyridoxal phosphate-dependent aminotransferase family protein [Verrucomicrobiota bacterium]
MEVGEPMQPVRHTHIRCRGNTLLYFGGCDYHRLTGHPRILAAIATGLRRYGLSMAASRCTTGNHKIYGQLEAQLARFFAAETAILTNSGYVTNLMLAQALQGEFSHVLLDERAHVSLLDAAVLLQCPVWRFAHRHVAGLTAALRRCGRRARPLVLTDGLYAGDGSIAPLAGYLKQLPQTGLLVVDDAHGAGTVGATGRGSLEAERVPPDRIVQTITLSKAFGVYGGAILAPRRVADKVRQSHLFVGSTPLPLPLAHAAITALRLLANDRRRLLRLAANTERVKARLRANGFPHCEFPGPVVPVQLRSLQANAQLKAALIARKILPPFLKYPGSPARGYFRFVISSAHTKGQLDQLTETLIPFSPLTVR